jgi:AcrR family transcriptional regulator
MSSLSAAEPARRDLGSRQADRVDALVEATVAELREHGYDGLTVRNAARRAGVAAATAYTYFGSKEHLVAEVFWRRLQTLDGGTSRARTPVTRVQAALRSLALLIAAEPELAAASTTAILANDPDVHRLRNRIGAAFNDHLSTALGGEAADAAVLRALNLALAGALLQAGMGYFSYTELADRMDEVAVLVVGGGSHR